MQPLKSGSCWYYVTAQVLKHKSQFTIVDNYELFRADLDVLHRSQSEDEYHHGAQLFYTKWIERELKIMTWFDTEYFGWRQAFYACLSPPGIPSTNDPLENNNKLLKKFGTKQRLMIIGGFLKAMKHHLEHESSDREMGGEFPSSFSLTYNDWRKAQEWLKSVSSDKILRAKGKQTFCVPSTVLLQQHGKDISSTDLKQFLGKWNQKVVPLRGENFDSYTQSRGSFYVLQELKEENIVSQYIVDCCSCVMYWKYAHCKHALVVGICQGKFAVPAKFSLASIGPKGKRGRKRVVKNSCYGLPPKNI